MGQNLTNIIITQPNGNRVPMSNRRTATGVMQARQNWTLNGVDTVDITVVSGVPQQYNVGDQITIFGRDYKLNRMPSVRKKGEREYEYSLQFEGVQYDLFRVTYDVNIDTTTNLLQDIQGDSLTGNLKRFMDVLIANANRVFPGKWKAGVCPVTMADKTLTFGESDNCLSVLQNLCNEDNFNVEFDIQQIGGVYTINLHERVGKVLPFTFEYGKGQGLMNIVRENVSSSNIVTRLKVFGSSENITSKYRASRLCLPGKTKGQSYIEKPEMVAKYGIFEGRKDFNDIKPTFTGCIEAKDGDYAFVDTKFPFDINAKDANGTLYLMAGTPAKIHFNTGNLAGYEFDVTSYDHSTHKFTIRKITDERGNEFPSKVSSAYQFSIGDTYKVLDIAYSSDIELKAEQELLDAANKYYDHNCQPKVQYGVTVTPAYLEQLVGIADAVVNIFAPGDFLHVIDKEIGVDKSIRIKSLVRDVLSPYSYNLTIADDVADASITNRVVSDLNSIDKIVQMNNLNNPARARANWRSSREVLDMVFDADGDYYTDKIKPNSIDTAALSVGAKSMQFGLTNIMFQPNYEGNPNFVKWVGGMLTHYTIKKDATAVWTMADGEVVMADNSAVYVYAKCERTGNVGTFIFTSDQIRVDDDANYYHFLVGTLSSVDNIIKARSLALTYGFTTVNGRFIRTGRIESADGTTYFDLDKSEIGGRIVFSSNGEQKTLEGLGADVMGNKDFISNILPGTITNIQSQLDGKCEVWFQETDPALQWTTPELKVQHVGDMWYNAKENNLKHYTDSYAWDIINDQKAIDAFDTANKAQNTANNKKRVFVVTPTTPYDIGDLWVDGKVLRRCITSKTSSQSYDVNDWADAVSYDNTKTVIDGGLVTSGTIQVGSNSGKIRAGITGKAKIGNENSTEALHNDDAVRFWAGSDYANREIAPSRILDNGNGFFANLYSFFPAFEINATNKNKYIDESGAIRIDLVGSKVFFATGLGAAFNIRLPKGSKYLGAVIEVFNPIGYGLSVCGDIVPPHLCTLNNMFTNGEYHGSLAPPYGTYTTLKIQYIGNSMQYTPRWTYSSYATCQNTTDKYRYIRLKCVAIPPYYISTNPLNLTLNTFEIAPTSGGVHYEAMWVIEEYLMV